MARPDFVEFEYDAFWWACNYLVVGMICLQDNPLLREPLTQEHIKNRLLGHWGSNSGSVTKTNDTQASAHHSPRILSKRPQNSSDAVLHVGQSARSTTCGEWIETNELHLSHRHSEARSGDATPS